MHGSGDGGAPHPLSVGVVTSDDLHTPIHRPPSLTTMTSGMLSAPLVLVNTFHNVQPPPSPVVPSLRPRRQRVSTPSASQATAWNGGGGVDGGGANSPEPPMACSQSSEEGFGFGFGSGPGPEYDASDALGESAPLLDVCGRCAAARQCAFEALDPHLMPSHLARHWIAYAAGAAAIVSATVALGTSSRLRRSVRSWSAGVVESMRSFFHEHIWQPTTMIW